MGGLLLGMCGNLKNRLNGQKLQRGLNKGLNMDITKYTVLLSKNAHPEIIEKLDSLLELIDVEWKRWEGKSIVKTVRLLIECRTTLHIVKSFIREDNLKAAALTMMKHMSFVKDLPKCFYRKKKTGQAALKMLSKFLEGMKNWCKEGEFEVIREPQLYGAFGLIKKT